MTRTNWLKSLKRGDKIWVVVDRLYADPNIPCWKKTFDGWFDFKGSKGRHCLLGRDYGIPIQWPKAKIFPSKKEALIYAIPIVCRKMSKEINDLEKDRAKLLDKYDELLETK
jgi:hypothetical protein